MFLERIRSLFSLKKKFKINFGNFFVGFKVPKTYLRDYVVSWEPNPSIEFKCLNWLLGLLQFVLNKFIVLLKYKKKVTKPNLLNNTKSKL